MQATIRTEVLRYIVCPGCGEGSNRCDQMDGFPVGRSFGPWICDECGMAYAGHTTEGGGAEIEMRPAEKRLPGLLLVEIGESTPPVYAVLEWSIYHPDDPASWEMSYFVDEHTCPTNLIRVERFLYEGDPDPHGVLSFVQLVARPKGYEEPESYEGWRALFDKLPVVPIG